MLGGASTNDTPSRSIARSPKAVLAALLFVLVFAIAFPFGQALAATPLIHDGVVSGSIDAAEEVDEFTFDASAGDSVLIRVIDTTGD